MQAYKTFKKIAFACVRLHTTLRVFCFSTFKVIIFLLTGETSYQCVIDRVLEALRLIKKARKRMVVLRICVV